MNQAETTLQWIDDVNGGAIRYVNAEANFALVGKESVRAAEAAILGKRKVDDRELIAVDLLGRNSGNFHNCASNVSMRGFESSQCFGFIVQNIDARDPPDESVPANAARFKRCKLLDRGLLSRRGIGRDAKRSRAILMSFRDAYPWRSCHCLYGRFSTESRAEPNC